MIDFCCDKSHLVLQERREEESDFLSAEQRPELFICFCSTKDYLRSFFPHFDSVQVILHAQRKLVLGL